MNDIANGGHRRPTGLGAWCVVASLISFASCAAFFCAAVSTRIWNCTQQTTCHSAARSGVPLHPFFGYPHLTQEQQLAMIYFEERARIFFLV
jgi:hypothetical protein